MKRFLIIQTAFIGDVILATPLIEKLHEFYPEAEIDFLLRKGNEGLLAAHPHVNHVIIWNKKEGKYKSLFKTAKKVRRGKYDVLINLHRFASSGWITFRSGAKEKLGFDKNPFAFTYTKKFSHEIGSGKHEIQRNLELIEHLTNSAKVMPRLYPSDEDYNLVKSYQESPYFCIAPTSVWYTKQWPAEKWIELINQIGEQTTTYLLGGPDDLDACESIKKRAYNKNVTNLAGELSFLQSAALMSGAKMNYVNDSAPLHIASAMNAPVTAIFCSTIPDFGFGPLSDDSHIAETTEQLDCRPCGLHGLKACPKGHFKCAEIMVPQFSE